MIGVVARDGQRAAAAELFELFKTPWEPAGPGRDLDVVLASDPLPEGLAGRLLTILAGRAARPGAPWDDGDGAGPAGRMLRCKDVLFPVYGHAREVAPGPGDEVVVASEDGRPYGVRSRTGSATLVRLGYDPLAEAARLLGTFGPGGDGQPVERALVPTLDIHIAVLRDLILEAGAPLAEIPPAPAGRELMACLTHDIDFFRLRDHVLDHSMLGFLHRAVVGSAAKFARGRLGPAPLGRNLLAAASLPLVLAGGLPDPWTGFGRYMAAEQGVSSTFFLIPFKGRPGDRMDTLGRPHPARRAARYDVTDLGGWVPALRRAGHEIGVHGIDAWHSDEAGRTELDRVAGACGPSRPEALGIRMHWLAFDRTSFGAIERAGFRYDSTVGYNQTPGFRAGTAQVYRPLGADRLLELPMIVQDVSLFYPAYLDLDQDRGLDLCRRMAGLAARFGGALTINWHDRSLAPERLWGGCYLGLLDELRRRGARLCGAGEAVDWFAARRAVRLADDRVADGWLRLTVEGPARPDLAVRVWLPDPASGAGPDRPDHPVLGGHRYVDVPWTGEAEVRIPLPRTFRDALPAGPDPASPGLLGQGGRTTSNRVKEY